MSGITCLVTIHGIGFQQPPVPATDGGGPAQPGYADQLHSLLHASGRLPDLADDPHRLPDVRGPIYVQRPWQEKENGLGRLDPDQPLVVGEPQVGSIAHVALVYSGLEQTGPRLGSTLDTLARATLGLHHYVHPFGAAHLLFADLVAMVRPPARPDDAQPSSLRPRVDLTPIVGKGSGGTRAAVPVTTSAHTRRLLDHAHRPEGKVAQATRMNVMSTLEHDVASYVCRNDLRERLRGFVQEVLEALDGRDDVAGIVINAHSQGTVLALDVLARYVPRKLAGVITAGSPLRKYVDLFAWGDRVGLLGEVVAPGFWWNFYDALDPVADPLAPPRSWRADEQVPTAPSRTLMRVPLRDDEVPHGTRDCSVTDIQVHNVDHCEGPLAAHNYWDNTEEFVPALAEFLTRAAAAPIGKATS